MAELKIISNDTQYLIYGDISKVIDKKMSLHLKRSFKANIKSDLIEIPINGDKVISLLSDFFKKKGIRLILDEESSSDLSELYEEEENFRQFSLKAKDIWENNIEMDEFKHFCSVIENGMQRKLYKLQLLSAYHLAFSQNACNFSVPGAGKTSIVYGAYTYLKSFTNSHPKSVDKILVIGPLSSFGPWENEYQECFNRIPNVKRISGGVLSAIEKKQYFHSRNPAELTLISYPGILNQMENLQYFLKNNKVMVIIDEAHKIKNTSGGQIADSVLKLAPFCRGRVVLTGTPAPNGYQDLFNLFKFIWPNKDLIPFSVLQLDDMTKGQSDPRVDVLIDKLSPYFVRIKKSDLGLPEKKENDPILVEMDKSQEYIYRKIEKKVLSSLKDEDFEDSFLSKLQKAKLIRLMQAASNPKLLLKPLIDEYGTSINDSFIDDDDDKELIEAIYSYADAEKFPNKFYEAYKIIKQLIDNKEKVIVWALYVDTIHSFQDFLESKNIETKILYGKTKVESENTNLDEDTRESIIRDFHVQESSFKVIIANPFAVAESISLHKACHNAIYLERNFDAARYVQSKDRIHRYGLDYATITNYYYLMSANTIDATIDRRLQEKEDLMIRVTESQDIPLFRNNDEDMDDNDIKALITDYANKS
ncbi:DEAD/DEAH box helicase [Microbacterium sp. APC 3898]|uniref:DEAD/DEAH box helicase n=1 Tax=Planococcus notacanthi TaxID=3035188 RepID=A0ABT7ZJW6_9BACL|nr:MULTISPECIES: DEAD/DEAH box helicase [Terrabacteria group]MDN3427443.1 DEAD/DEAH box helicase [Planococcus sp. APC 4016]MDN3498995.1 DEAD/DEAH box helicase [Microbacterium sp. APC 3898]